VRDKLYHKLRKHLDHHPIPYPATQSGVEIELLKSLFTPEEAEITLILSALFERPEKIYPRLKKIDSTLDDLEKKLLDMLKKGLIRGTRDRKNKEKYLFSKMPMAVGIYEAQVDKINYETARLFEAYEKEAFGEALLNNKTHQLRTIPLNIKIEPDYQVSNYDDITKIIKRSPGPFAVMNCICRQAKDTMHQKCSTTNERETCILIEEGVNFAQNLGVGRAISKDETLKLITKAKKSGLVLQPENSQHPHFVCCCCGCCCGVLNSAKLYDKPAKYLHSNYFAEINAEACEVCETCTERCPMDAIRGKNNHMETDLDRCIGCGACVPTCKERAIKLVKKERDYVPPKTAGDMYKKIMVERFGWFGTAKFVAKAALGMKI